MVISKKLKETIEIVKANKDPILIIGPTGTGKSRLARLIHKIVYLHDQKKLQKKDEIKDQKEIEDEKIEDCYLAINPLVYGDTLASNLFGHKKGAFTTALENRIGFLANINLKTILIDEIAELSLEVQGKLLVVLDTKKVLPIGSNEADPIRPRIIAATNKNIYDSNIFRNDLVARFPIRITLEPFHELELEERDQILDEIINDIGKEKCELDETGRSFIHKGHWPRNNREIYNLIKQSVDYRKLKTTALTNASGKIKIDRELLQDTAVRIGASNVYIPLDTPQIDCSMLKNAYVKSLLDELKQNLASGIHDQWSIERLKSGWKYGDTRNDVLRTNPCLVHFDLLPKSEKEVDIKVAERTLYEMFSQKNIDLLTELAILFFAAARQDEGQDERQDERQGGDKRKSIFDHLKELSVIATSNAGMGANFLNIDPKTFSSFCPEKKKLK